MTSTVNGHCSSSSPDSISSCSPIVWKFGGTSLADAKKISNVSHLVSQRTDCLLFVVVSAMAGVTNMLVEACLESKKYFHYAKECSKRMHAQERKRCDDACSDIVNHADRLPVEYAESDGHRNYTELIEKLKTKHMQAANELSIQPELKESFLVMLQADIRKIYQLLDVIAATGVCPETLEEQVTSFGERWSAALLWAVLRGCKDLRTLYMDARDVLIIKECVASTEGDVGNSMIELDWVRSRQALESWMPDRTSNCVVVVTGFICSNPDGTGGTLKRNGSDYSASLMAALSKARELTVWTDVDGIFTADPRKVPDSFRLPYVSYSEAIELAYFGAKVLHPHTMGPCIDHQIPMWLRSSMNPECPGTLISSSHEKQKCRSPADQDYEDYAFVDLSSCKAFTTIDDVTLLNVEGTSMIGVPGIASRLFAAVHLVKCSVIMISMASSEHSVCLAVKTCEAERAADAVRNAFYKEISGDGSMDLSLESGCSIICAVGDKMRGCRGILGRLTCAISIAGVNVKAVAQGSSERNITLVVASKDVSMALNSMHASVYGDDTPKVPSRVRKPLNAGKQLTDVVFLVAELSRESSEQIAKLIIADDVRLVAVTDGALFSESVESAQAGKTLPNADCLLTSLTCATLVDLRNQLSPPMPETKLSQETFVTKWLEGGRVVISQGQLMVNSRLERLRESTQ
eukprot:GHVQ01030321.1.p1 GENE.GHVQ01030321.1~~GHVQ01030321.1.p1  ORF type:complete len:690 (+),score=75.37 GHVQ01030321.1:521-2590(+)